MVDISYIIKNTNTVKVPFKTLKHLRNLNDLK